VHKFDDHLVKSEGKFQVPFIPRAYAAFETGWNSIGIGDKRNSNRFAVVHHKQRTGTQLMKWLPFAIQQVLTLFGALTECSG
jgi:hypothetical protein